MTKEFKHGVLYPIDQAPFDVPVMLWVHATPDKSFPMARRPDGWKAEGGYHVSSVDSTHFSLWPEPPKYFNSWDRHIYGRNLCCESLFGTAVNIFPKSATGEILNGIIILRDFFNHYYPPENDA